jgi:hypothetical protein
MGQGCGNMDDKKYISAQTAKTQILMDGKMTAMKDIKWSIFGNIADDGCGVIAAYNVLLSRNLASDFGSLKREMENAGTAALFGLLGVNPFVLANYMGKKCGIVQTFGPFALKHGIDDAMFRSMKSIIIMLKWVNQLTMHYVAGVEGAEGVFRFYNTDLSALGIGDVDGQAMSAADFFNALKDNGDTALYAIGIF